MIAVTNDVVNEIKIDEGTIVLRKGNVFDLIKVLTKAGNVSDSAKFSYFVAKNLNKLKAEAKKVESLIHSYSPKFVEFDRKRIDLNEKYCSRDDAGKILTTKDEYVIDPSHVEEFQKELEALKTEYAETLEKEAERMKAVDEYLNKPLDNDLHKIKLSQMSNKVTAEEMQILMPLVEDDLC